LQPGEDPCEFKPGAPDPVLVWIDTQILQKGCRGLQSPLKQVFPTNPTGEEEEKEQENYHQTTSTCFIKPPKKISKKKERTTEPYCCLHTSFFIIPKPSNTPNKKAEHKKARGKQKKRMHIFFVCLLYNTRSFRMNHTKRTEQKGRIFSVSFFFW